MIEIIPNWHPIFVNFTVALFSISLLFYTASYLFNKLSVYKEISSELEIAARWCLLAVGLITIMTVIAGLYAANTVKHDHSAHLAIIAHRNWAFVTMIGILFSTIWSLWQVSKQKTITALFIIALCIVEGLLLSTAWHGAEVVFRHGVGVMSLPNIEDRQHHHGD